MKPLLIAFSLLLSFNQYGFAEPIDPATAATVGKHFFQSTKRGQALADNVQLELVYSSNEVAPIESPRQFYIFNVNYTRGFVIVAGDDAVTPILGYSDAGPFDPNDIPINMEKWLEHYRHEIFFIVENKIKATGPIQSEWKTLRSTVPINNADNSSVDPLLTTTWDQSPYYNELCPGGSVTGCVATAMAQIMKYWNHPVSGQGEHSYLENDYGTLYANFGATIYGWFNMPNNLNSNNDDVAKLMYHCGVSVNMDYSPSVSGTYSENVPGALINYFSYDSGCNLVNQGSYSDAGWVAMFKGELDAGRPVQHSGSGNGGAHAFVCDGYDDNNKFHINWGWGGGSNGYFIMNSLNPTFLGIGSGSGGGYSTNQKAIIGIKPNATPAPSLRTVSGVAVSPQPLVFNQSYAVVSSVRNTAVNTFNGKVGVAIYKKFNYSFVQFIDSMDVSLAPINGTASINFSGTLKLLPGNYYVTILYKKQGTNVWTQVPDMPAPSSTEVQVVSSNTVEIADALVLANNPIEQNSSFTISTKVKAPGAVGFSGSVAAYLHKPDGEFIMEIDRIDNLSLAQAQTSGFLHFYSSGLNVAPGSYNIALWTKHGSEPWKVVSPSVNGGSFITVSVVPPALQPDIYEPNDADVNGIELALNFVNDVAYVHTEGSNIHQPNDADFFYFTLPTGYYYTVKPRVHDSYNNPNGFYYTNDVRWSYRAGSSNPWSDSYDGVLLAPGMSFSSQGADYVDFHIVPYYPGTLGTYLFEATITRSLTSKTETLLPETAFGLFPNPASDYSIVSVKDPETTLKRIQVYSMAGQLLQSQELVNGSENRIQTGNLPPGIYVVSVVGEAGVWNSRLSVTH
ncbi:MAG: C10 family peptidase [Saprospiraceae bacterium]|nr:C10 family peptidase [Saprospiraceae bacterium]